MKQVLVALLCGTLSVSALAQVRVKGYYKKNGTYVAPHYRSAPNSNKYDNYSTKGNYNPYTGKPGTVDPYRTETYIPQVQPILPYQPYPKTPTELVTTTEQAGKQLEALAARLRAQDPYFSIRQPIMVDKIDRMVATVSPSLWVGEAERMYWEIPVAKDGVGTYQQPSYGQARMLPVYLCRTTDRFYYSDTNEGGCAFMGELPTPAVLPQIRTP